MRGARFYSTQRRRDAERFEEEKTIALLFFLPEVLRVSVSLRQENPGVFHA
jgi:hypothetical protein